MRWVVAELLVLVLLAGCAPGQVQPPAESGSAALIPTASDVTAGMPFALTFPSGWTPATPKNADWEAFLDEMASTNPELAQQLRESDRAVTGEFVAYETASDEPLTPNVSCRTQDRGSLAATAVLDLAEQQNVEAIAQLPGLVEPPTSDRLSLPAGETVRVRWRWTAPAGEGTSLGYLFVADPLVVTCVFTAGSETVDHHEPEWLSILGTFELRSSGAPGAS